jgi:RND family efflux transporter MFP subunit
MRNPIARPIRVQIPLGPAAVIGCCCLFAMAGCSSSAGSPATPEPELLPTIDAEVITLDLRQWPRAIRSQGSLIANEVTVLGAKVAGRVSEVHVDLGDSVRAGAALVSLNQEEFRLEVIQAEAQLSQARSAVGLDAGESLDSLLPENAPPVRQERAVWDEAKARLNRGEKLLADNAISDFEYDQTVAAERVAEARFASAINGVREKLALIEVRQAELSLARQRFEDAVIRAAFDGVIQERQVSPGTYLQVGQPVVTLVSTGVLRYRGRIPERHAQHLAVGQQVTLQIESVKQPRSVLVSRISPALDRVTRSLLFEAELENLNSELRTGLFAEAEIVVDPDAVAIVVPHSAIIEFAGSEKVWRVVENVAGEHEVRTGQRRVTGVEILEGLRSGDEILADAGAGRVGTVRRAAASAGAPKASHGSNTD